MLMLYGIVSILLFLIGVGFKVYSHRVKYATDAYAYYFVALLCWVGSGALAIFAAMEL